MYENVILVDKQDREIGQEEKLAAHEKGLLHRAFSIFILANDSQDILMQQRQQGKYHSAGLWSNTCCSHPRSGEETLAAGKRRLQEEMGFQCALEDIGSFIYRAELDSGLVEHELDHVLIGYLSPKSIFTVNPEEVQKTRWQSINDLEQDLIQQPQTYTAWLAPALDRVKTYLTTK